MEYIAISKNVRSGPRKLRVIADLVKGSSVPLAKEKLTFLIKKGAEPVLKTLDSALANATNNSKVSAETLKLKNILIDEGRVLMRKYDRAHGFRFSRGYVRRKSSHITVILSD